MKVVIEKPASFNLLVLALIEAVKLGCFDDIIDMKEGGVKNAATERRCG